jgi:hypothetical protein
VPESGSLRAPESGSLGTPKSDTHRDIRDTQRYNYIYIYIPWTTKHHFFPGDELITGFSHGDARIFGV